MSSASRFVLTILFSCSFFVPVSGQNREFSNPLIDSLKLQLNYVTDSAKVDLLNQIAYNYYYYDNDSTDDYAEEAIELATKLNYKIGLSEAQRMMGIAFKSQNKERESLNWLNKGLETAKSINYHQGIADNLNSLGIFYHSIEDWEQAIQFFKQSVEHQIFAGNKLREGLLYANIGVIYLMKNQLDSSDYFFQKSQVIIDATNDDRWIAMLYSQYAALLIRQNDLKKAEEYSIKSLELSKKEGQTIHLRKSYQNLAEIYFEQKKYNESIQMAHEVLSLSEQIGFFPYLMEAHEIKYKIYSTLGQYEKALFNHEMYATYRDSLRLEQINSEAGLLTYQIELENKEKENLILRNEAKTQEARNLANKALIQRQTIIGIGIIIILILVSIVALIFFRLRQKERDANAKLIDSNKELEEQKEELSATLQMVEHLNAQLQAQNTTLNKIAIVSITDLEGNIISVNDNFCNATGYSRDELLGNNHRILNSGEHSNTTFSLLWDTITNGETWRGELKNRKKNGDYFWGDTAIAPIFNDEGKPKQFFSLQFDITERKNYLNELASKGGELEDLNKLKDKLLSIVSHDFRGPLNSLRGTLNLFLKGAITDEELNMLTENLVEKLDNTYNLLENLLNWAKSQMDGMKVYMKEIDLSTISKDCVDLLSPIADKKLVKIKNNIKEPIRAFADNEMVKLILRNLLSNAIKFTTAGNEVILEVKADKNFVTLSVKDNGLGISNEDQDKIFKLGNFSTRGTSNETGMGLGLLLCKDFVEKNGGNIWFKSELGKGTTFYFTLPHEEKTVTQILA